MNDNTNFLIEHNKRQSKDFLSPDQVQKREDYQRQHKTDVMITKCMDGRVNVPVITGIPMGVFAPYRSMGAVFDIGSPGFAPHVRGFYEHVRGRRIKEGEANGIVINTYHFSKGSRERGCKGFGFDTERACKCTKLLRGDFEEVYGKAHAHVYPVCVGVETDEDALVIHGEGKTLDVSEHLGYSEEDFRRELRLMFPDMKDVVLEDLLPLVVGNRAHVEKVKKEHKPIVELDHRESTIAVGRGFDWLHLVNHALIVGTFNVDWLHEVSVAAHIVHENLKREPELAAKGATLIASAPYRKPGVDAAVSRQKAMSMARAAWARVKKNEPGLLENFKLELLVGTLDRNTMLMDWIDVDPESFE
ncbi:MAG: hypothetical protein JWL87_717 [Candidatus Adlerbacteria bacterium]|nr:hypothetical protein [Candidatus Adlerbacteria bacterium]